MSRHQARLPTSGRHPSQRMAEQLARGSEWPPVWGTWLGVVIWGGIALAANLLTPFWSDDWCRIGIIGGGALAEGIARDYMGWTGRLGPLLIMALTFGPARLVGIPLFEIANSLLFMVLTLGLLVLAKAATRREPASFAGQLGLSLAAGLLLWWAPKSIAEVALWKTGSIMYLWPVTAAVLLLCEILRIMRGHHMTRTRCVVVTLATAFFATFLEPISVIMLGVLFLAAGWAWWQGLAQMRMLGWLLGAQFVGTVALLVAPGNFERAGLLPAGELGQWSKTWFWFLRGLVDRYAAVLFASIACVWIAAWSIASANGERLRALRPALIGVLPGLAPFFLIAAAYMLILLPLPANGKTHRLGFPVSVAMCGMALVLLSDAIRRLEQVSRIRLPLLWMTAALALLLMPVSTAAALRDVAWVAGLQRDFPALPLVRPAEPAATEFLMSRPPEAANRPWVAEKSQYFLMPASDPSFWANRCLADAAGVSAVHLR